MPGDSRGGEPGTITGANMKCIDVAADDVGTNGSKIQLWDCQTYAHDQHWSYQLSDNTLHSLGRCLDIVGDGTANLTPVQLWDCNPGVGGQNWFARTDGSLFNPQSGRCLESTSGDDGALLHISDCSGTDLQKFKVTAIAGTGVVGVTFYQDINFGGSSSAPKPQGDYATLPADIPDNWVSSLKLPKGWVLDAYPDPDFGGTVCTFKANATWVGDSCNDKFSSFKIH